MAQSVAEQLGNYHLIKLVGEDGFTENYLGEHRKSRALAVIRVLHTKLAGDDVERFLNEAHPLVNLMHSHILRVLEFGVEESTPFLVVEYAPHGNLRRRHPKGTRLPLSTIMDYVKQVADGLKYAHERNLVHHDIKPENMQLDRHDEVLLSDFSTDLIARTSSKEGNSEIAGTILYMAPEQIEGKPVPASDQYSLGVVVYEWLSGNCPFEGSFNEIAVQHLMTPPPSLHELFPTISPELEQVVMTALAKDPKGRFGTISAFANALSQVHQADMTQPFVPSYVTKPLPNPDTPVGADVSRPSPIDRPTASIVLMTPPTGGPTISLVSPEASPVTPPTGTPVALNATPVSEQSTARGPVVSRRTVVAGLVGVGLVVAGGGLAWQTQRLLGSGTLPGGQVTSVTSALTPTPHIAPGSEVLKNSLLVYRGHTAQVEAVAWSPDGGFIASASYDKTVQIWDAVSGSPYSTYRGHSDKLRSVAYSPDGTLIASSSDDQTAQVWKVATGKRLLTYKGHTGSVHRVSWSPDGKYIVSASADQTLQVWEAATGKRLLTYKGHTGQVRVVAWSHNGQYIVSGDDSFKLHVWEAATGNKIFIYRRHKGAVGGVAWSPDDKRITSSGTNLDHTAQVWDAITGTNVLAYRNHQRAIWGLAWSPGGQYIVSASNDDTAQVWDAATGKPFITYIGHNDEVIPVAWSPDSTRIVSGSRDKTARVWKVT